MSAPKFRLRFSPQADQDLEHILQHSLEQWGEAQQTRYAAALERSFLLLADNPNIGRPKEDIYPGCRAHPVEQHIIYYVVIRRSIRVLRILHRRMDVRRAFQDAP